MDIPTFKAKWQANGSADGLSERAGAQAHFHDLCDLLGVDKPDEEILRRLLALNLERTAQQASAAN